ncbi:MAG: LysM peptidoglycan-binding domain-containing protein [Peptococcaceae bacterium]|nr:LysM peptidoglycan-binding domain-containing protein [Peptococcaceae bacterium]
MNYWIYEVFNQKKPLLIHKADCRYCRDGEGLKDGNQDGVNGQWHGSFDTVDAAWEFAKSIKDRETRFCMSCSRKQADEYAVVDIDFPDGEIIADQPDVKLEPEVETVVEAKTVAVAATETVAAAEAKAKAVVEAVVEAKAATKPEVEVKPETEAITESDSKPDAETDAEDDTEVDAEFVTLAKADSKAKKKSSVGCFILLVLGLVLVALLVFWLFKSCSQQPSTSGDDLQPPVSTESTEPESGAPSTEPESGTPSTEPESGTPSTEPESGAPSFADIKAAFPNATLVDGVPSIPDITLADMQAKFPGITLDALQEQYPGFEFAAAAVPDVPDTPAVPDGAVEEYTVVRGDTLWAIAQRKLDYGYRYPEIMTLNDLTSDELNPGQILRIPNK